MVWVTGGILYNPVHVLVLRAPGIQAVDCAVSSKGAFTALFRNVQTLPPGSDLREGIVCFGIVNGVGNVLWLASVWKLVNKDKNQYHPGSIYDTIS
ncbi:hypothetical protein BGZ47_009292 [Haplosporangium gracile]|nr:hypothetical protein BGZ47_009292 [Haplosporangium gracile]